MMNRELSKEQIEELFNFVKSKYVRYVDLQYELVDHLASSIEEEMDNDASLTFQTALEKVYSRFPISGFSKIVRAKEKEMFNYWLRKMGKWYLEFIKPPQILILIAMTFTINELSKLNYGVYLVLVIVVAFGIYTSYKSYQFSKTYRKAQEKMLVMQQFEGAFSGLPIVVQLLIFVDSTNFNIYASLFIAVLLLSMYAGAFVFSKMLKEELEQKYAHIDIDQLMIK